MPITTGEVMDMAAALMNDTAKSIFTYEVQIPYLKMALDELSLAFERGNVPITNKTSSVLNVAAGVDRITFNSTPKLPADLIDIQELWESDEDQDQFIPMTRREFLPHYLEGIESSQFLVYTWQEQEIRLLPANTDIDLKIDYIGSLFPKVILPSGGDTINVINSKLYLGYKTAAFCAQFIGENETRASELSGLAEEKMNIMEGISAKGRQGFVVRRKPFQVAYRSRRF